MDALVQRILDSRSVHLYGSNLSALPAQELYIALQFVPGIVATLPQLDTVPHFAADDLMIVYSAARGDRHQGLMQHLRHEGVTKPHCVLVTTNGKHALRRNFDEVIVLESDFTTSKAFSSIVYQGVGRGLVRSIEEERKALASRAFGVGDSCLRQASFFGQGAWADGCGENLISRS